MPLHIVFNASSKPAGGKSLNDCLLTGTTLTAKLHDILLSFRKGEFACTADISKAFHRVKVNERDRDYRKFLWVNKEQTKTLMYRFKVVLFGTNCSPYLLQEILHAHFTEDIMGHPFINNFYVDNYMNTYNDQTSFIKDKVILDQVMSKANMPLQEWVSNDDFNILYKLEVPETENVLGLDWEPNRDTLHITARDKITKIPAVD